MLKVLDLFSGIGGFSLGLERTGGFETVAFCEIEDYPRNVLAKHWPDVPCYEDVKMITKERLEQDEIGQIDVICGGFPCQDISAAGKGAGLAGERSGLWFEYARIIREVGPRWVIIENVSTLRGRGLSVVLQNLSEIGYDAEWHCITAASVGAPHRRDRVWIITYPSSPQLKRHQGRVLREQKGGPTERGGEDLRQSDGETSPDLIRPDDKVMADTDNGHRPREVKRVLGKQSWETPSGFTGGGEDTADTPWGGCRWLPERGLGGMVDGFSPWLDEPDIPRVAKGQTDRVNRLKCLGNAVVPQVVTMLGHAILEAEKSR